MNFSGLLKTLLRQFIRISFELTFHIGHLITLALQKLRPCRPTSFRRMTWWKCAIVLDSFL